MRLRRAWGGRRIQSPAPYNLPLSLSEAMLGEGTTRSHELLPVDPAVDPFPLPPCREGFEVFSADGKAIKYVKRLLKPLRGLQAGIPGARSSVALNVRTGTGPRDASVRRHEWH